MVVMQTSNMVITAQHQNPISQRLENTVCPLDVEIMSEPDWCGTLRDGSGLANGAINYRAEFRQQKTPAPPIRLTFRLCHPRKEEK